uniref:Uncharacterized protein n=1 Tax=Anguilla anguilla TaxID=7936 RepID=A0A0E9UGQ1_ANGAN
MRSHAPRCTWACSSVRLPRWHTPGLLYCEPWGCGNFWGGASAHTVLWRFSSTLVAVFKVVHH